MLTLSEIQQVTNIHRIPKSVHCNRGVLFDYRLVRALTAPTEKDIKYDFDVFLPKYGINLQRPYVWNSTQQREFILSILLEKPIDDIVAVQHIQDWQRDVITSYIIDGKQRLLTIKKFVEGEFPIIVKGKEYYYKDFNEELQRFFTSRANSLTATVYYSYDDVPVDDDMKIILFNYYNFAGTPQTQEHKDRLQQIYDKNNKPCTT